MSNPRNAHPKHGTKTFATEHISFTTRRFLITLFLLQTLSSTPLMGGIKNRSNASAIYNSNGIQVSTSFFNEKQNNEKDRKLSDLNDDKIWTQNRDDNPAAIKKRTVRQDTFAQDNKPEEPEELGDFVSHPTKLTWSSAILGALFGCSMFFLVFIIIISVLASIRAVDYYIFGRKDIRKELLSGEEDSSSPGPIWKILNAWRPNGKPGGTQPSQKPQFWKTQMFHV
ncbi:uncharacterized protein LOC134854507 isoform X2 [Symsagittifera roscoffensis]